MAEHQNIKNLSKTQGKSRPTLKAPGLVRTIDPVQNHLKRRGLK